MEKIFSYNLFNGQISLQMLSDMDQNGVSGIVRQSEEEPAKLKSSTKFLSFLIIHNFSVYFFYLNHKMLKNTFLMVKNSLQIGLYSPPRFRISQTG